MNVQQVITGALNRIQSPFDVGNVHGVNFTACAVGCDVVILGSDFERIQIINASNHETQILAIHTCAVTWKIAAAFGNVIRIYEPHETAFSSLSDADEESRQRAHKLVSHWTEASSITTSKSCFNQNHCAAMSPTMCVNSMAWTASGNRLLINLENGLELWDCSSRAGTAWKLIWSKQLASSVLEHLAFSPDGTLFATISQVDLDEKTSADGKSSMGYEDHDSTTKDEMPDTPLHEALASDRADMTSRWDYIKRKRQWLSAHQDLLRTFASYCALHGSQGVGLASARMELFLLMLELHQESILSSQPGITPILPAQTSFPLLTASVASFKTDVAGPIRYIHCQTKDLLISISEEIYPPNLRLSSSVSKVYLLYNLGQCLSACLYESLSDIENMPSTTGGTRMSGGSSFLLRKRKRGVSICDVDAVTTIPEKWPGVQNMIALLSREREEDSPTLIHLLIQSFAAVYLAIFSYAFTTYDSRWLYRLMAQPINETMFAMIFGGGGEKRIETTSSAAATDRSRPSRPSRPPPPQTTQHSSTGGQQSNNLLPSSTTALVSTNLDKITENIDPSNIRNKFHAKVCDSPHGRSFDYIPLFGLE